MLFSWMEKRAAIGKLVEEKSDGGVRVAVEDFGKRNLIFVDEDQKGSGGDAWRKRLYL